MNSIVIRNKTFINCKLKHLPIMQSMKSSRLSRIKFTDTSLFLGSFLRSAR